MIPTTKSGKQTNPMMVQYANFYQDAKTIYGERVAVLMQVGSFYECYYYYNDEKTTETEYATNMYELADIMNLKVSLYTNRLDYSITNPYRCGFTIEQLSKYKDMLLDKNYTVVVVDQLANPIEREISHIYM